MHGIIQGPPGPPQLPNYLSSKEQINLFPRPPLSSQRVSLIPMSSVPTHVNSMSSHVQSSLFILNITLPLSQDELSKVEKTMVNECQELTRTTIPNESTASQILRRRSAPSTKYLASNASMLPRGLRQQCTTVGGFMKCNHFRNALATFSDPPSKAVVVMNNW